MPGNEMKGTARSARDPWELDLRDGAVLRSPDGEVVRFRYRKVLKLLKAVVESPSATIDKDEVAALLWPDVCDQARQVSLRQALHQLRASMGAEIESVDGDLVLRSPSVRVLRKTGAESAASEKSEEDWAAQSPVSGFRQMLHWFAERDPLQMLDLMRANMDLAMGIWPSDLRVLLETAARRLPINHRLPGWVAFWRGYEAVLSQDIERASSLFNLAVELAVSEKDYMLAVEALLWLGSSEILLLRYDSAQRIADRGSHMVALLTDRSLKGKIDQLRGTILIHQARTHEGLSVLEQVGGADGRLLDQAQAEALRGLYHACAGHSEIALRLLEVPERIADETKHFRLESICGLARGYAVLAMQEAAQAVEVLDPLIAKAAHAQLYHFEIYAREAAAVALWKQAERPNAHEQLSSAQKKRKSLKMGYTEWDKQRLRALRQGG